MTVTAIKAKHWVLRHYLWISVAILIVGVVCGLMIGPKWQEWIAILGVPAAFLVGAQRQKREELELFRELFKEFNERYDRMNEKLYEILEGPEDSAFSAKERNLLFDYFNLCGEEYLYYAQGYIYPEVWNAWRHGMLIFRRNRRIKRFWDLELGTGSYYGLTFDDGEAGCETEECSTAERENDRRENGDLRHAA